MSGQKVRASHVDTAIDPKRRVLVVDDSEDARAILELILKKLGHEARTAEDAQRGMAVSRDFRPEIIFCDIMLPGDMSGYAFAKAARMDEALGEFSLVAVSGRDGSEHEQQAYEAGFDRVLKKPVELNELTNILRTPPRRVPPACTT